MPSPRPEVRMCPIWLSPGQSVDGLKPVLHLLVLCPIYRKASVSTETSNLPLHPVEVPWMLSQRRKAHRACGVSCATLPRGPPVSSSLPQCPLGSRGWWGGHTLQLGLGHLWSMGHAGLSPLLLLLGPGGISLDRC